MGDREKELQTFLIKKDYFSQGGFLALALMLLEMDNIVG